MSEIRIIKKIKKHPYDLSFAAMGIYYFLESKNGFSSLDSLYKISKESKNEVDLIIDELIENQYVEKV